MILVFLSMPNNESQVFFLFSFHLSNYPSLPQQYTAKQTPHPGLPIAIVYCTLINPSRRWKELLTLQMAELRTFGLASRALSIHVELSTDGDLFAPSNYLNKENTNVLDTAAEIVQALVPTAKVAVHSNNTFEYPGIHRVWEVATQHSDLPASTVLLYFHGKGMVNGEDGVIRSRGNEMLTRVVIEPWREILQHFQEKTELMKVGYAMAREGHVWHNFFWARASYVRRVVEPIISADRYYYEGWLGKLKPYDEETKEPLELQPTAAGPDEEQEFYQADAKDGLTLCGNNELKPGVAYEALAVPWC